MLNIKPGDLVWHQKFGKGMCIGVSFQRGEFLFEGGRSHLMHIKDRESFFKKGDLVVDERQDSSKSQSGTFIGWTDNTHLTTETLIIKTLGAWPEYCSSLKHQKNSVMSLVFKVNGKEISPPTLSKETWDNLLEELKNDREK